MGYKLSDVIDGVVNPVFKGGTFYVVTDAQPVQGLWPKDAQLDDADANAYLEEATSSMPLVVADAHTHVEHQSEHLIEINGKSYAENESLTAEYAEREGGLAWGLGPRQ